MHTISAIIVNYDGIDCVKDCIDSLKRQTMAGEMEIIVVDNDSKDGSLGLIKRSFADVKVVEMGYNAGWGVACNAGINASGGRYLVMLNNDIYLDNRCVEEMVKAVELDERYGSCASRVLLWEDHKKTEVAGVVLYPDGLSVARGRLEPADRYKKLEEVFCASDCCCLFRREMIEEIGGYDTDFFIYADDTDIGWKHRIAGWRCVYAPEAVSYHKHSHKSGGYSSFKAFHVERNRLYICIKYFPIPSLIAGVFFSAYRYIFQFFTAVFGHKGAFCEYRKGHSFMEGIGIILKAYWCAIRNFGLFWEKRQALKRIKRISNSEIHNLIRRFSITTREIARYE
ncbi:MAG: glycosyltransferase family 2 protein [Candidatus Omnitrophica bacterium]|nr:glycosyltransferase family 2 protein [Candidatus Omnitrophota bacterium]